MNSCLFNVSFKSRTADAASEIYDAITEMLSKNSGELSIYTRYTRKLINDAGSQYDYDVRGVICYDDEEDLHVLVDKTDDALQAQFPDNYIEFVCRLEVPASIIENEFHLMVMEGNSKAQAWLDKL